MFPEFLKNSNEIPLFRQNLSFKEYFYAKTRVQTVMNVQHGGFKFFVIFIVPWTILSDQKNFKIFWMHFGENRPFLLLPCKKLKIQKKFDQKVVKNFFSQK